MSVSALRSSLYLARILYGNKRVLSSPISKTLFSISQKNIQTVSRSLYFLNRNRDSDFFAKIRLSNTYSCSCGLHSKGDEELAAFLNDEIENEKKAEKPFNIDRLEDFQCELNEAEVVLTKKINNEIIKIKTNVNSSVDAEDTVVDPSEGPSEPPEPEMKAKPEFTIEIKKGKKVFSFHCVYNYSTSGEAGESGNDVFQISEISIHEGEFEDHTYTVAGDIMDGYLYDLLMNYLEERGITNDFAEKMISFFTSYEHKLYISLLQKVKSFVEK